MKSDPDTPSVAAVTVPTASLSTTAAATVNRSITSRAEFQAALRSGFEQAAALGSPALWLADADFVDWPLGERAVIADLDRWVAANRRLTLLATSFDEVARRHPRWVAWRVRWSHIVSCRVNAELGVGAMPSLLLAPGLLTVHLADRLRFRGRLSGDKVDEIRCKELIDAVSQRSEEAFGVSITGL